MSLTSWDQDVRDASHAGYSDGFYRYRADTGDWSPRASAAYHDAYRVGRADALAGSWHPPHLILKTNRQSPRP